MTSDIDEAPSVESTDDAPAVFDTYSDMLSTARRQYKSGEYQRALATLDSSPTDWRLKEETCRLARDCHMKVGEISKALGEVNRIRQYPHPDSIDRQARFLLGRLIETDPEWTPHTPLPGALDKRDGVILHLLKESLPYSETGFTLRSRMTLAAQRLAGFEPVVVTSLGFPNYKGGEAGGTKETIDDVVHYRLESDRPYPSNFRVPYDMMLDEQARLTAAIADDVAPALIQAGSGFRGYDQALVGISLADRADLPFVYEVRGFLEATWTGDADRAERGEYYRRRRAQEKRCLDRADHVITIAEAMKEEIIKRDIPPEKVSVVPNAVDIERFTPRTKRPDLLSRYGLNDLQVVGYISNIGKREGIHHLVEATYRLLTQGHDVACLVVGDGPERDRLEKFANDLGLGKRAVFTGHVPNEEIEDHYALIDFFVVPRIVDRASRLVTPLKPLEAMAMGIPTVASNLPALRELVEPTVRGLVFEPGDTSELVECLSTLLDDDELREGLARNGQDWVRANRTLESNKRRYERVLARLV